MAPTDSRSGPLASIRVLDLTQGIAGPFCTRLFAGMGAEVVKVERPGGGDPMRSRGPFIEGRSGPDRSIPFHWLNAGKKGVVIDLERAEGRDLLERLIREADVVVENFMPKTAERLGLTYEEVRRIQPRIVMTSITNFGQSGPYRDYEGAEIVLYALSGCMYSTGDPDAPPLMAGPAVAQYSAGMHGYVGALMALFRRGRGETGEHVDVSIQEGAIENIELQITEFIHLGRKSKRNSDRHPLVPWQCYPCKDGYAAIFGGPVRHWLKAVEMFEEPRLLEPDLRSMAGRMQNRERFESLIQPWLNRHGRHEIGRMGRARKLAFAHLADLSEAVEWEQHQARGFIRDLEPHPDLGALPSCGPPFRFEGVPWRMGRAPKLGEHTEEVLAQRLGLDAAAVSDLKEKGIVG